MKRSILITICALVGFALQLGIVTADPVTFVENKTTHFAHKTANKIDRHVIQPTERHVIEPTDRHVIEPARRTIVNHTPRSHHHHHHDD